MNGDPEDVWRSLRQYVSWALQSPPWTVRTERQNVSDDDRPVAVVEPGSPVSTLFARATIPQGDVRKQQAFSVMCYPPIEQTARESRAEASIAVSLLEDAVTNGLVDARSGAWIGGPMRVPVWDFGGVPVEGRDRGGPVNVEPPGLFANVEDLTTRALQDPIDPVRYTVACDLRLTWWQGGRSADAAPNVARWGGVWAPPGDQGYPPLSVP